MEIIVEEFGHLGVTKFEGVCVKVPRVIFVIELAKIPIYGQTIDVVKGRKGESKEFFLYPHSKLPGIVLAYSLGPYEHIRMGT